MVLFALLILALPYYQAYCRFRGIDTLNNYEQLVIGFYGWTNRTLTVYNILQGDDRFILLELSCISNDTLSNIHLLVIDVDTIIEEDINATELGLKLWYSGKGILITGFYPAYNECTYWSFSTAGTIGHLCVNIHENLGDMETSRTLFESEVIGGVITYWQALNGFMTHSTSTDKEVIPYDGGIAAIETLQLVGGWTGSDTKYNYWYAELTYTVVQGSNCMVINWGGAQLEVSFEVLEERSYYHPPINGSYSEHHYKYGRTSRDVNVASAEGTSTGIDVFCPEDHILHGRDLHVYVSMCTPNQVDPNTSLVPPEWLRNLDAIIK